jgi:hypothetical protein
MNQIVRWTTTKDAHADDIINICSHYFLCQRLTPVDDAHQKSHALKQLRLVHHIMVVAMKCKQSTDVKQVEKLEELLQAFAKAYGEHKN